MINFLLNSQGNLNLTEIITWIFATIFTIFLTLPIHEYAHAKIAVALGDDTPRYTGRLSLNPFAHIDWLGAFSIFVFGIGWAKPVSVNMFNFKKPRIGMAAVAAAGPLSNLLVALVFLLLYNGCLAIFLNTFWGAVAFIGEIFFWVAFVNISLAVFNLLPIPPFDGSRILGILLPQNVYYKIMRYEQYILYGVLALLFLGVFDKPLEIANSFLLNFLNRIALFPYTALGLIK